MTITAAPTSTTTPAAGTGEAKAAGADLFQLILNHAVENGADMVAGTPPVITPAKAPTKPAAADTVTAAADPTGAVSLAALAGLVPPTIVSAGTPPKSETPLVTAAPTPAKAPVDTSSTPAPSLTAPVFTAAPLATTPAVDTGPNPAPALSGRPKTLERIVSTPPSREPAGGAAATPFTTAPHAEVPATITAVPPAATGTLTGAPAPTQAAAPVAAAFTAAPLTATLSNAPGELPTERPRLVDASPAPRTVAAADASTASLTPAPTPQLVTAPTAPAAVQQVIAPNPQQPLTQQLAQPLMTLAQGENGEKTVVVRVAPDELGPVTVRAHLSDTTVRFELSAPSAAGREALRHILPELRADLNSASTNGFVNVADQNGQTADSKAHAQQAWAQPQEGNRRGQTAGGGQDAPEPRTAPRRSVYTLDVLA